MNGKRLTILFLGLGLLLIVVTGGRCKDGKR